MKTPGGSWPSHLCARPFGGGALAAARRFSRRGRGARGGNRLVSGIKKDRSRNRLEHVEVSTSKAGVLLAKKGEGKKERITTKKAIGGRGRVSDWESCPLCRETKIPTDIEASEGIIGGKASMFKEVGKRDILNAWGKEGEGCLGCIRPVRFRFRTCGGEKGRGIMGGMFVPY